MWLKNEILRLRALEESDLPLLYEWENNTNYWEYSNTLMPYSQTTLLEYIRSCNTDFLSLETFKLVIELSDKTPIGILDVFNINHFHARAELGILLDPNHRGKGYASMAYILFKDYAFNYLKWVNLYTIISKENSPMHHVALRAGFCKTGTLKKWIRTSQGFEDADIYTCVNSFYI